MKYLTKENYFLKNSKNTEIKLKKRHVRKRILFSILILGLLISSGMSGCAKKLNVIRN